MLERDAAGGALHGMAAVVHLVRHIQKGAHIVRCQQNRLQWNADVRQVFQRRDHLQHGHDKRHKFADGGCARTALPQRDKNHNRQRDRCNQLADGRARGIGLRDFFVCLQHDAVHFVEAAPRIVVTAVHFHHTVPRMQLVERVDHLPGACLRADLHVFQAFAVIARQQRQAGEHEQHHQAQLPVQIQQHADKPGHNQRIAHQCDKNGARAADGVAGLVHNPIGNHAGRFFLLHIRRQQQHFAEHILPQAADGLQADPRHQITAGKTPDAAHDNQKHQKQRHGPDFVFRAPNPVIQAVFPIQQPIEPMPRIGKLRRCLRHAEALIHQRRDKRRQIAFRRRHADDGHHRGGNAPFIRADISRQADKAARVVRAEATEE